MVLKLYFSVEFGVKAESVTYADNALQIEQDKGVIISIPIYKKPFDTALSFVFDADTIVDKETRMLLFTKDKIFFFKPNILKDYIREHKHFIKKRDDLWELRLDFISRNVLGVISLSKNEYEDSFNSNERYIKGDSS